MVLHTGSLDAKVSDHSSFFVFIKKIKCKNILLGLILWGYFHFVLVFSKVSFLVPEFLTQIPF